MIINYYSPAMQGGRLHTLIEEPSYSEVPGHTPSLCEPGGFAEAADHPLAVVPFAGPVRMHLPNGGEAIIPVGSIGVAAPGTKAHADEAFLVFPMPQSRMGDVAAFDHGGRIVRGDPSVVYRPLIESAADYSAGRMVLRNELPYVAAAPDRVTSYVLLRGQAIAVAWRPEQDHLLSPFLTTLSEHRISPMSILNTEPGRGDTTLQHVLEALLNAAGSELSSNPRIGAPDSGLIFAHPLIERTVVTAYPGEMLMLVSVASWVTPEFVVLTSC